MKARIVVKDKPAVVIELEGTVRELSNYTVDTLEIELREPRYALPPPEDSTAGSSDTPDPEPRQPASSSQRQVEPAEGEGPIGGDVVVPAPNAVEPPARRRTSEDIDRLIRDALKVTPTIPTAVLAKRLGVPEGTVRRLRLAVQSAKAEPRPRPLGRRTAEGSRSISAELVVRATEAWMMDESTRDWAEEHDVRNFDLLSTLVTETLKQVGIDRHTGVKARTVSHAKWDSLSRPERLQIAARAMGVRPGSRHDELESTADGATPRSA